MQCENLTSGLFPYARACASHYGGLARKIGTGRGGATGMKRPKGMVLFLKTSKRRDPQFVLNQNLWQAPSMDSCLSFSEQRAASNELCS